MAKLKNIILQDGGKIVLDTESSEPTLSIETTSGKSVKLNIKGNVELSGGSITIRLPGSTVGFDLPTVVNNLGKQYESNKKNLEDLIEKHNQRTKELSDFIETNEEQSAQFAIEFENMQGVNTEISERIRGYEEEAQAQAETIQDLSGRLETNARELTDLLSQNNTQTADLQDFLDEAMGENGAISVRLDGLRNELEGQIDSTASLMLSAEDIMNQIAEAMSQNLQESQNFRTALESMITTNDDISERISNLRSELEGQITSAENLLASAVSNFESSVAQIEQNKKDSEDFQAAFTNLTSENGDIATRINGLRGDFEGEIAATAALIKSAEEIMSEIATSITENRIESEAFKDAIDGVIAENSSIENSISALRQGLQGQIDSTNTLLNTVSGSLDETAQAVKANKDESDRWRTETLPGIITTNADVAGQINTAKGELQGQINETNTLLNTVSGSLDQTAQAVEDNKRESDRWRTETLPGIITTNADVANQIDAAKTTLQTEIDGINRNLENNYQTAEQTSDAINGLQQTILDSEQLSSKIDDAKTAIINDISASLGDVESDISRLVQSNAASLSLEAADIEEALIGSNVIAKQSDVENATNEKIRNLKDTDIHDIRSYAVNATIAAGAAQIEAIAASGSAAQAKNSAELSYDMSTFAKESAISSYSAAGIAIKSSGNALLAVDLAALQAQASMRYAESSAQLSGLSSQSATNAGNASRQSADAAGISIAAAGESLLASSTALQAATWSDARANRASVLAGQSATSAGLSAQGAAQSAQSAGISITAAGESLLASSTSLQAATWSDARANRASILAGQSATSAGLSAQGAQQSATSAGYSIKAAGESLLASSTSLQAATWSDTRANRASILAGQSAASAGLSAQGAQQSATSAGYSIKAAGESLLASSTSLQAATWSDARANRASILAGQAGVSAIDSVQAAQQSAESAGTSIKAAGESLLASSTSLQAATWSDARANRASILAGQASTAAGTAAQGAQQSVNSAGISLKAAGDSLLASTTALQAASWSDARANMAGLFATNANTSAGLSLSSAQSSLTSAGLAIKSSADSLLASTTALQAASWSDARANMAGLFATNANQSADAAIASAQSSLNSAATALSVGKRLGFVNASGVISDNVISKYSFSEDYLSIQYPFTDSAGSQYSTPTVLTSIFTFRTGRSIAVISHPTRFPAGDYQREGEGLVFMVNNYNKDLNTGASIHPYWCYDDPNTYYDDGPALTKGRTEIHFKTTLNDQPWARPGTNRLVDWTSASDVSNPDYRGCWPSFVVDPEGARTQCYKLMPRKRSKTSGTSSHDQRVNYTLTQRAGHDTFKARCWHIVSDNYSRSSSWTVHDALCFIYGDFNFHSDEILKTRGTSSSGTNNVVAVIRNNIDADVLDFTGQHRSEFPEFKQEFDVQEYIGKIVVSTGEYSSPIDDNIVVQDPTDFIRINESIPKIELSSKANDKKAFGVISGREEEGISGYSAGAFLSELARKDESDNRTVVNSLGEGAIWVTNINGNLENGDYITTCEIPGYGMRQDDDLLHNYTVAKITCDCNFDLDSEIYKCEEFEFEGTTYRKAFVGCTYHCG